MRTLILVGATIAALGSATAVANAGALWIAKHKTYECYSVNANVPQASCVKNYISSNGYSNSHNQQTWLQGNIAVVPQNDVQDIDQKNIGVNVINRGSYNKQHQTQANVILFGNPGQNDEIEQKNTSINTVEKGYGNNQKATQVNIAGGGDFDDDVEQKNTATNHVENGNGNTQKATQMNVVVGDADDDVEQKNTATNHVGNGNGNYQGGTQVNALVTY